MFPRMSQEMPAASLTGICSTFLERKCNHFEEESCDLLRNALTRYALAGVFLLPCDSPLFLSSSTSKSGLSKLETNEFNAKTILAQWAWNFLSCANLSFGKFLNGNIWMYSGYCSRNLKIVIIAAERATFPRAEKSARFAGSISVDCRHFNGVDGS